MKPFKSIAMVKYPPALVWTTIRDRLPELAPLLDDIENITTVERTEEPDGVIRLVNFWKASVQIPPMLATVIKPGTLAWTDRAAWHPLRLQCHWRIELPFLPDQPQYTGLTSYEAALGGRGTRITFEGQLNTPMRTLASSSPFLEAALTKGTESVVTTLIPKNFHKLIQAVSTFLDSEA